MIALVVVGSIVVGGLAGLFIFSARLIRRDINDRFERIEGRIEDDARALVQNLLNDDKGA
jgi:hypothetical protein